MKIKAILLDVGGVLVQTVNKDLLKVWEKQLNLPSGELLKIIYKLEPADKATVGYISQDKIWQDIGTRFTLSTDELDQLEKDFYIGQQVNTQLYNFIKNIRGDYKIAIFSDAWGNARSIYTKKYHLDKIADQMIISAEEGLEKPSKQFLNLALQRVDCLPEETLYIDDTLRDTKVAKEMGIHTIWFRNNEQAIKDIERELTLQRSTGII